MWVVERSSEAMPEIEDPDRLAYEAELTSASERSRPRFVKVLAFGIQLLDDGEYRMNREGLRYFPKG